MLLERFGWSYTEALWIGTSIIVAYTFVGGFLAVSWTDFFQGTLMFICLLVVPFYASSEFGDGKEHSILLKAMGPIFYRPLLSSMLY